jgi:type IV secretion system protein VirB9
MRYCTYGSVIFLLSVAVTGPVLATTSIADNPPAHPLIVPAIQATPPAASITVDRVPGTPPPVNLLSGRQPPLTTRETLSVSLANRWKQSRFRPGIGEAGRVVFRFGATLPTVVCAPLYVCDIELQAGEVVNNINIGDAVRWIVSPATSGEGDRLTTQVIIKATDSNLTTNLIIATNRRTYVIKLLSRQHDWIPLVSFSYPEDEARQWAALQTEQQKERAASILPDSGQDIAHLQFNYQLTGDNPDWKPLRIYTDGRKTYIQFPPSMPYSDAPALVALGASAGLFSGPSQQLVNYRVTGDRYVVDKVLERAALISGIGREQVKVTITREGGN